MKFHVDFTMSFDLDETKQQQMMKELGVKRPEEVPTALAKAMGDGLSEDMGDGFTMTLGAVRVEV